MTSRDGVAKLVPRALGGTAALLAAMAAIAGDPHPRRPRAQLDVAALAGVIERQEDHVTALELAEWIRDHKRGLRVADVRSRDEFEEYHIPSAELLALSEIPELAPGDGETWVLYSEGGAHAAQAWMLMRAMGHERVYFLRGGILDWAEDVMNPVLVPPTTAETRRQNEHVAEVSRYFGGVPRAGDPATRPDTSERTTTLDRTRRRGC